MDKKETGLKLVNTVVWGVVAYVFGRFLITPTGKYLEDKVSNLNLGFKNPLDADNFTLNSIEEGQFKTIPSLALKSVFSTENADVWINPFVENTPLISWRFGKGENIGRLTGTFAKFKGIVLAELNLTNKGVGWIDTNKITKV